MKAIFLLDDDRTERQLHLSTQHSASSYGQGVVVTEDGEAVDQFSWSLYRTTWASDPEVEAFEAAGYSVRWALEFTAYLPTSPTYWGADCTPELAERCCDIAESAIRSYIDTTWPGAECEFRRWPNDGGLPALSVEPGGRDSAYVGQLALFVERHWTEWAQEADR